MITGQQFADYWYKNIHKKYPPIIQTGKMDDYLEKNGISPEVRKKVVDYWWKELNGKQPINQKQKLATFFNYAVMKKEESISLSDLMKEDMPYGDMKDFSQKVTKLNQAIYALQAHKATKSNKLIATAFAELEKSVYKFVIEANNIF